MTLKELVDFCCTTIFVGLLVLFVLWAYSDKDADDKIIDFTMKILGWFM